MALDKRIIKTRKAIKGAFMSLVMVKNVSKISVSDLAEKAQINRSTFYLHYKDVHSVLQAIQCDIDREISAEFEKFDVSNIHSSLRTLFTDLNNRLNENPMVKDFLFNSTYSRQIMESLKKVLVEKNAVQFPALEESPEKHRLVLSMLSSGVIDSFVKWFNGEIQLTFEEFCATVCNVAELTLLHIDKII